MAVRTISTRLAIEGDAAYKQAIRDINNELKTLGSALKLTESEYKGNANSIDALTAKSKALNDTQEAQSRKVKELKDALANAREAQEKHANTAQEARDKIAKVEEELAKLGETAGDTSKREAELKAELEKLNGELANAEGKQAAATRGVLDYERQLNNAQAELNNLDRAIQDNNKYLDEAKNSADGTAKSIDEYGNATEKSADAVDALGSALAAAGIAAAIKEITQALKESIDASIEFESAFAGVLKTVDGTDEQLAAISDGIKNMALEIPASTTEIAAVAEAAGQLGIKTQDILGFTEVMINLGVATNMSADEAATSLARFANITGMSADKFEALGSTVVALGNKFATTEREIVDMGMRIAAAGSQIGLTESEIMGVATALSSVGLEAQAGGTAVSKVMVDMAAAVQTGSEKLGDFASVAGMTNEEFSALFGADAAGAMGAFFAGLGEGGDSAIVKLKEMGVEETRLRDTLLRLSGSQELFTDALELSGRAMAENTALADEAGKRYATTESKLKLFENAATGLRRAIGDALTPALANMADAGKDAFEWATDFIEENPWLVKAMTAVTVGLGAVTLALGGYIAISKAAAAATAALNAAMLANPYLGVAAAAAGLIAVIGTLVLVNGTAENSTRDLLKAQEESAKAYADSADSAGKQSQRTQALMRTLDELTAKENKTTTDKRAILEVVKQLNAELPELNLAYDEQADELNKTNKELANHIELQAKAARQSKQIERLIELKTEQADIEDELAKKQQALAAAQDEYNQAIESGAEFTGRFYNEADKASVETARLEGEVALLTAALEANRDEYGALYDEVNGYSGALDDASQANLTLLEQIETTAQGIEAEIQTLQKAYDDAYRSARDSIDKQIGQWEKMDNKAKTSVAELAVAVDSQLTYLQKYAENYESLSKRGVDGVEILLAAFSDGSKESAKALAGLATASDEEIAKLVENMKKTEEGKDELARIMAETATDFDAKMADIEKRHNEMIAEINQYDAAQANAAQTAQGVVDGLQSKREAIAAEVAAINRLLSQLGDASAKLPGHADGLYRVPYDDYVARLHKDERVLTAVEAEEYDRMIERSLAVGGSKITNTTNYTSGNVSSVQGGDTYHITIDAANVREFNDVVRMAKNARQARRAK